MENFLILYDTKESELARDFKDILDEIGVKNVKLIPLSSNEGRTLEAKEDHYFNSAYGTLFIITPRSKSENKYECSTSVAVEIGMAISKFNKNPEKIVLLLEDGCQKPTTVQRAYIPFNRNAIGSIVKAITMMIKDLKAANCIYTTLQHEGFDVTISSGALSSHEKEAVLYISKQKNGHIKYIDFEGYLKKEFNYDDQKVNFLETNVVGLGIVKSAQFGSGWILTRKGWAVAKYLYQNYKPEPKKNLNDKIAECYIKKNTLR